MWEDDHYDPDFSTRFKHLFAFQEHLWRQKQMDLAFPLTESINLEEPHEVLRKKLWIGDVVSSMCDKIQFDVVIGFDSSVPYEYPSHVKADVYFFALEDSSNAPMGDILPQVISLMHEKISSGKTVLVHCQAGVSRSATACIAYVMKYMDLPFEAAYMVVKCARPIISPNLGFIRLLRKAQFL